MSPQTNTQQPIDFSPLKEPVTDVDIAAYKKHSGTTPKASAVILTIFLVFFCGIPLVIIPWSIIDDLKLGGLSALLVLIVWIAIVGAVAYGIMRVFRAQTRNAARLYKFATRNNLTFIQELVAPGYAGMIFDEGHTRRVTMGFVFPGRAELGNYEYVTGSGKNRTTHEWVYVKVKLPRKLPHMVLDAKKNNLLGMFSNLTDSFKREQALALEGDFNDHFTLYAPKEYERDALYVFTPDVMAKLVDNGGAFDMEVIGDELFIYRSGKFNLASETELTSLLSIVEKIGGELHEQTDYYADERVADRSQNIVAPQGARLKRGVNWLTIILFILAAFFFFQPHIEAFFER